MKVGLKYYTSFIIQNVIIWPHSLNTFSNYSSSRATEYTKKCHGHFDWLQPKTLSIKNSYYDRKVRELLEIDMAVVKDKIKCWAMKTLLRQMRRNFYSEKWKQSIETWRHIA